MAETNLMYEDTNGGQYCFTCAVKAIIDWNFVIKPKTDIYDYHKCEACHKYLNDKVII